MIILDFTDAPTNAWGIANFAREAKFDNGGEESCLKMLYKAIGCDMVDVVEIAHGIDMWVDDEALYKIGHKSNWLATMLRTAFWAKSGGAIDIPADYPQIFGKAVLLGRDDEGKSIDLSPEQVEYIRSLMDVKTGGEA